MRRYTRTSVLVLAITLSTLVARPAFAQDLEVTNLGLYGFPNVGPDLVAFQVNENLQGGTDLNGDGDIFDRVVHFFQPSTGATTNVGLGSFDTPRVLQDVLAFWASESQEGMDLNGDGDTGDFVAHLFQPSTGTTTNLGLATRGDCPPNCGAEPALHLGADLVAFEVAESAQGGTDLNGDGDFFDDVLHVFQPSTATTTNLGLATFGEEELVVLGPDLVAFQVFEPREGSTDLNGDGDATDFVLHVFRPSTGVTTNLGLATVRGDGGVIVEQDLLAFLVDEEGQEDTDLNGDGDAFDFVLHVFQPSTGATNNLGLATLNGFGVGVTSDLVAIPVREEDQGGTDLNGDGDATDFVLHTFQPSTGTTTNQGLAVTQAGASVATDLVAFSVVEFGGADLNGDGDAFDSVLHLFQPSTGTITNLGLASFAGSVAQDLVAFRVRESEQGGTDLNGDGDIADFVGHVFQPSTGTTTNLLLADFGNLKVTPDLVAFTVRESAQGGMDLNSDGDATDRVLHVFLNSTETTTNTGLAVFRFGGAAAQGLAAFPVSESDQGGTDLNGDGDATDFVVHVIARPPTPEEQVETLSSEVETLVAEGVVNQGQGNSLIVKLDAALNLLDAGNTIGACQKLQDFINQANAFINAGILTDSQGQELIDSATEIRDTIGC